MRRTTAGTALRRHSVRQLMRMCVRAAPAQLLAFFSAHAPVNCVRLRRHAASKAFKGSVFVEFASLADAEKVRGARRARSGARAAGQGRLARTVGAGLLVWCGCAAQSSHHLLNACTLLQRAGAQEVVAALCCAWEPTLPGPPSRCLLW